MTSGPPLARDLVPGTVVGDYILEERLGRGAFGEVHRATHALIGKQAAVKVLLGEHSSDEETVARFLAEARAVNQIRHRNIIDIFAFGTLDDGRRYLVMELLSGGTLKQHLARYGRLSTDEALPLLRGVAEALEAAHAAGITHRDLKPDNVFLVNDADGGRPKLLDFGIAKLADGNHLTETATGAMLGTPFYMSPEQFRGRSVDHRADIFAFGVLCYETLTGGRPFVAETLGDLLLKVVKEEPRLPSSFTGDIPAAADAAIIAMLAKAPAARPSSILAAYNALAQALGGLTVSAVKARPESLPDAPAWETPTRIDEARIPTVCLPAIDVIGDDRALTELAQGVAADLSVSVGMHSSLRVVACPAGGEPMAARFVARGSLQGRGMRVRLSYRLEEVTSGNQVWSQRYDRTLDDPFAVQDEFARALTSGLRSAIFKHVFEELRDREDGALSVSQLLDRALGIFIRSVDQNHVAEAALRRALSLDPENAMARGMLAFCLYRQCELSPVAPPQARREEILASIRAATEEGTKVAVHFAMKAVAYLELRGDVEGAQRHADEACALNPSFPPVHAMVAIMKIHRGDVGGGRAELEELLGVNLIDPNMPRYRRELVMASVAQGKLEEASALAARAVDEFPQVYRNRVLYAALLGLTSQEAAAGAQWTRLRSAASELTVANAYLPAPLSPDREALLRRGLERAASNART